MTAAGDQASVISFLCDHLAHGGQKVEIVKTHAAVVFLAGDRAFKMKQAVRYSYLDFSALADRRTVLERELELNRRTAPQLYLGIRCIVRYADGALHLVEPADADDGEIVEWLLVMRRFPDSARLDNVLNDGRLDRSLIHALADELVRFHQAAGIVSGEDGTERLRQVIDGNLASMNALPAGVLPTEDVVRLHNESMTVLDRVAPMLDKRAAEGHVRRCHGDLHLANIAVVDGRPLLFDCLEFDERLAQTDTLYDLAFLLMDLWVRDARAPANALMNRYADLGGEVEGLGLLPLFLSVRAAVRAHVAAVSAKPDRIETARNYLSAALAFLQPKPVTVVAVGGLSGTGKSTLAAVIAPSRGAAPGARLLRSDVIRKRMAGVLPEERLPPESYTRAASAAVFARMAADTQQLVGNGISVVADAVFGKEQERRDLRQAAGGAPFAGLWLEAPANALKQRVGARRGDASDANVPVVESQLSRSIPRPADWHRIDAGKGPADTARQAADLLRRYMV